MVKIEGPANPAHMHSPLCLRQRSVSPLQTQLSPATSSHGRTRGTAGVSQREISAQLPAHPQLLLRAEVLRQGWTDRHFSTIRTPLLG
ncbi:hypothetical protein AAFF_G00004410 [Aldrovandia affinis]|uniref:Uncharacterized protein n=1 Tax=Aldrovandia affinis TaxID=143900 RepID=A0AAD7TE62_9TELE|nr:hypothetical protein AAFF_G00004410 [Aldrovandia affinis]